MQKSGYVKLDDSVNDDTEPISLTNEDIDYICTFIDEVSIYSRDDNTNKNIRECITNSIREQLKDIKLVNLKEAKDLLIEVLRATYKEALAPDGYMAGVVSSQSISSSVTQATLDSFKDIKAAATLVEGGIGSLEALLYTRMERKGAARMIVHFTKRMSKMDIINLRALLVDVKLSSIIRNVKYGQISNKKSTKREYITRQVWHTMFEVANDVKIQNGTWAIRIYLDNVDMYAHKITMTMVANAIDLAMEHSTEAYIVYSPIVHGYIDIIYYNNEIEEEIQQSFLNVQFDRMKLVKIKGVDGIDDITPHSFDMKFLIKKEQYDEDNGTWRIELDKDNRLINRALFKCTPEFELYLDEMGYAYERIEDDYNEIIGYELYSDDEIKDSPKKRSERMGIDSFYYYMITKGSNYREILKFPWCDPNRTIPNDIFKIYRYLGVEASRAYFIFEFDLVLEAIRCGEINPRHLSLMTDVVYFTGKPHGMTTQGSMARSQDFVTRSVTNRGADNLMAAAINRQKSDVSNLSTMNLLGSEPMFCGDKANIRNPTDEYIIKLETTMKNREKKKRIRRQPNQEMINMYKRKAELEHQSILESIKADVKVEDISIPDTIEPSEEIKKGEITYTDMIPSMLTSVQVPIPVTKDVKDIVDTITRLYGDPELVTKDNIQPKKFYLTLINKKRTTNVMMNDETKDMLSKLGKSKGKETLIEIPVSDFTFVRDNAYTKPTIVSEPMYIFPISLERSTYPEPLGDIDTDAIIKLLKSVM